MNGLRELLSGPRYEVFPAKSTEQAVLDWVPAGMTVTVTAPGRPGAHRNRQTTTGGIDHHD